MVGGEFRKKGERTSHKRRGGKPKKGQTKGEP